MSANRNAALAAATGEFFVFRDADDRLAPDYVERAVAVLRGRPEGQLSETMTTRTNPPVFAAILRRHQALSVEHGEAFWQALLEQRAMLGHFKARYGRLEDAVHALRRRNRRPHHA